MYSESDYLKLSGLQHFSFCRRQWALIHIEDQWADNLHTVEGDILHKRAHDETIRENRKDLIIVRGIRLSSAKLGVSGQCDILEFHHAATGIPLEGHEGLWLPFPVEYKRGTSKQIDADRLQLCGQAMCLEEMLCCDIPEGALFYGETHRREKVFFDKELRCKVEKNLIEMHELYRKGHTPKVKRTKACNACSLKDICLPKLMKKYSASEYLSIAIKEDI
ncbi:MAG TPA: CRISPR-associated protein Cas4 [Lachnospiraceae bacterium]|nr:CRISPR-associated protein Cas4 [Lachnospiraceae bacterium]